MSHHNTHDKKNNYSFPLRNNSENILYYEVHTNASFICVEEKSNPMVQSPPQKPPKNRRQLGRSSKWLTHKYEDVKSACMSPDEKANLASELCWEVKITGVPRRPWTTTLANPWAQESLKVHVSKNKIECNRRRYQLLNSDLYLYPLEHFPAYTLTHTHNT